MSKPKQPDQLSVDAQAALDAGLSYGQYMAQKPRRHLITPANSALRNPPSAATGDIRYCKICGAPFDHVLTRRIKYCSDECFKIQHRNYIRNYRAAQQPE